mmetsp:Transcript_13116/g.14705  ORF Transcript_13116/g.14705 Transcript_13116/m.14705 type:complete len:105 (+) Transcript_13116:122-436(+)
MSVIIPLSSLIIRCPDDDMSSTCTYSNIVLRMPSNVSNSTITLATAVDDAIVVQVLPKYINCVLLSYCSIFRTTFYLICSTVLNSHNDDDNDDNSKLTRRWCDW